MWRDPLITRFFRLGSIRAKIVGDGRLQIMAKLNFFPKALLAAYHGDNPGGRICSEADFFDSILDDTLQPDRK